MSRQDRLKAALRDNLKRRKLQARGRAEPAADDGGKPGQEPKPDTTPPSEPERGMD
ncbi:hypothetical protein [Methylobacterium haplocladii]|uniref:Uncharacterized protein n=1 Tax=Methylobacterium haplocladii TaxID=1176176 RepID=A0A512IMB8_9HYPH|nr:hypothetical protein [Methylobacterium haplocladii]GEO98854.1 hypothetical protein MHA02_12420 [Methylobacterium haplocladii]GJD85129.1 hypothetical protein HPGCJGGD_3015 [Methylobacterium haplocladii]GLS58768.1 hypothetical protein GCM10007887_14330 [Methylobacterium haplocladii]